MSVPQGVITRGVVFIHSAPTSLCPHVQWALEHVLRRGIRLDWTSQPAGPRLQRTEFAWSGEAGTGSALASALRELSTVRFEVTEDGTSHTEGTRWQHTPSLGIHAATMSHAGSVLLSEERLRSLIDRASGDPYALQDALDEALGGPWDAELEAFRHAGEGAPVRWLHRAG